ncbi:zinc finger, C3HC4 type [Onchocerca flexuosa]|uniref:Zinc finger, C3HC4 type n=1 Tax=Onchocerca flexuosa TaxID=387005 RepID=A0A238BP13_9BILA|nr:zinc finger, C3HC4 type [Onchocerca flexuosa]
MKAVEDVPVRKLVADSGAFIKRVPLHNLGSEIYTVPGVISELKCEKMRHLLESLPYEIHIQEPTAESLHINFYKIMSKLYFILVTEFSKKTGDYPSLSAIDLKLLSLVHDLHLEQYGKDGLHYDFQTVSDKSATTYQPTKDILLKADNVGKNVAGTEKNSESEEMEGTDDVSDDANSDSGTWLNEGNVDEILGHVGEIAIPEKEMKVACVTTDFAMQNVILCLGLSLLSVNGYRIQQLKNYILRCWACFATTTVMTKRFCPRCGNNSLHRVAVSVAEDGTMQLHINWNRLQSARGLKYSLPAPKGGKHAGGPQLFEDQPMPQNRMARCHQDPTETGPFAMKDVTSRSAVLGIRSLQKTGRNPNIFGQMISDGEHGNIGGGSSSNAQQQQDQHQQPSSIRFVHGSSVGGGEDENIILLFLNQLLSNLSAQGAQIQLQITRDPNVHGNILHGPVADYAWGEGGLDQIVTQLLNQFEGGSTPVDPKLLANLPMTMVESKHIESGAQCTTCMETFKKDESVAILECQHIFHRDCILPWLRRHNTCPICRQTIDATKWSSNNPLDELD